MPYQRPDLSAYEADLKAHIQRVKNANSWDALRAEWLDQDQKRRELMTVRNIAHIRNTVDTTDSFYEAEIKYFNTNMPAISLLEKRSASLPAFSSICRALGV